MGEPIDHQPFRAGAAKIFRTCGVLLTIFVTLSGRVHADSTDTLGKPGPFGLPIPSPSFDKTPQRFVIDGQAYRIPRNYIFSTESLPNGALGNISMRALLPALSAITPETAYCFLNRQNPCNIEVMTIGLDDDVMPDGARRLELIRANSHPDKRAGPCGFEYYEGLGSVDHGGVVFDEFFTKFSYDRDLSILRCPKEGSSWAPVCNSYDNIGNGNGIYYIFPRARLCQWGEIKTRVLNLIASFQTSGG